MTWAQRLRLAASALVAATLLGGRCAQADPPQQPAADAGAVHRVMLLPPGPNNPRNSEGDLVVLADGRLMLIYSHFYGDGGGDHGPARLCARYSSDGGLTWTADDEVVVENEGDYNVMSVSLLRLSDGRIALFYLRKNSLADCRPVVRFSSDEARTWTEPRECITDRIAYHVMNNDRAVQLSTGRVVLPVALHQGPDGSFHSRARALCYYSDDGCKTFQPSATVLAMDDQPDNKSGLQEPGVVELKDGTLLMYCRTGAGSQYLSRSRDGGHTWSPATASAIVSPISPATIERIDATGELLIVWNDHCGREPDRKRTPLSVALSRDGGVTWSASKTLEDDPDGWYCYTAMEIIGERVVLAHCSGGPEFGNLGRTQITSFPLAWVRE